MRSDTDLMAVMAAERACERLIIQYAHLIDLGDPAEVADLFTEDGVWEGPARRWVGRERIRRGFGTRGRMLGRMSRHVCSPILVTVTGHGKATGLTYVVLFGAVAADDIDDEDVSLPVSRRSVGEYRDRFRHDGHSWLFESRRAFIRFADPPRSLRNADGWV